MGHDLVAEEVEIDPVLAAASLGASEQPAVERAGGFEVVDGEGEVEWIGHAAVYEGGGYPANLHAGS